MSAPHAGAAPVSPGASSAPAVPSAPNAPISAGSWVAVCALEEVPVLGARRVARPRGMPVALFRTAADEVYALLDRCPHKGGPLSQGIVAGQGVACPLHNWTIGLADGCARAPDVGATPVFACRVEGGQVMLLEAELAGHATDLSAPTAGPCGKLAKVAAVAVVA